MYCDWLLSIFSITNSYTWKRVFKSSPPFYFLDIGSLLSLDIVFYLLDPAQWEVFIEISMSDLLFHLIFQLVDKANGQFDSVWVS